MARVWDSLSEGWRNLMSRSASALTRFRRKPSGGAVEVIPADAPRWSLQIQVVERWGWVRADRAEAHFRHGVLTVRLPKQAADEPRRIRIV